MHQTCGPCGRPMHVCDADPNAFPACREARATWERLGGVTVIPDPDAEARAAYERHTGKSDWGALPEYMRAIWRAHVAGTLPPR